ncbi:MAG TPA: NADH-quinone oxidoreductase subunit C [Nitrososphaeraceae archaeon]|jgi:NADH-quinone oxidoreductase subunit C|nr:NADH-quinone oxidoreductase subunit C [Nitrososphaeraceae archaeon]
MNQNPSDNGDICIGENYKLLLTSSPSSSSTCLINPGHDTQFCAYSLSQAMRSLSSSSYSSSSSSSSSQPPSSSSEKPGKPSDKSLSNANPKDDLAKTSGDTSTKPDAEAAVVPSANIATNAPASVSGAKPTITKKEPDLPAFEKELISKLTSRFGDNKIKVIYARPFRIKIGVSTSDIIEVAAFIREALSFDHAEAVTGTDYPKDNQIELLYHLGSYSRDDLAGHILSLSTRVNRNDARSPTLINVFKSVEFHERETFEMLGVYFEGHPRNERFLLPEDWADIPPLRKDFRIKGR